jgi:hypothetical protein
MAIALAGLVLNFPASAQTDTNTNGDLPVAQRIEKTRAACIEGRRLICGKILKILPQGLVVESGYTNLLRPPLTRSWLAPATVTAARATNYLEIVTPGSVCVGLVFLTDTPKKKRPKPQKYDYVIIEGYPTGRYSYTAMGSIHRTVRRFSAVLDRAVAADLQAETVPEP